MADVFTWMCPHLDADCDGHLAGIVLRPDGVHFRDTSARVLAAWLIAQAQRHGVFADVRVDGPEAHAGRDDARRRDERNRVKKYILFDHDGVLVDTEFWYYKAGERALAEIGLTLDKDQYLRDMNQGLGTWAQARAAGIDEQTISRQREVRNEYYQEYLRTEAIEIEGVVETLAELSKYVRMAIVTTAKRADFEIIHEQRQIRQFMDFVLVREDYELTKPHPEPYLTGLEAPRSHQEETLVVEDSSRGLNSAVAAGIDCVIVYNDFTKAQDFSQASYRIET